MTLRVRCLLVLTDIAFRRLLQRSNSGTMSVELFSRRWTGSVAMARPRIHNGLPRGGLGYSGVVISAAILLASIKLDPEFALPICIGGAIASIWFAVGLRMDSNADEAYDTLILTNEDDSLWDEFQETRTSVVRISTIVIIAALASVAVCVYQLVALPPNA